MKPFFNNISEFLTMGGHAPYVFACYGLTLFFVVFGIFYAKNERKKFLKNLALQQARQKAKISKK